MADTPPKFTYTSVPTCPNCRAKLPELATLCKRCGQVLLRLHYQPKQRLVRDLLMTRGPESPTRIGFGGSRGSSKSRLGRDVALEVALTIAMSSAGVLVYIVARNLGNLEDNYIKKYRIERPDIMEYYRASPRPEFNLPNGATVAFRYADNPEDMTRLERGPEAFLIIVEQAEQFTEKELQQITKPNRWPNAPLGACKTLFLFNPGGPGTQFLQRVFYLKQYEGTERPSDFAFVQAFSWDNWAWFEQECPEFTEEQFYALPGDIPACAGEYNDEWLATIPDTHRFKIFVTRTSEGRKYWALPESMRMGDLFGRFDQFAGQYFAGVWDQRLCVLPTRIVDSLAQYWWTCLGVGTLIRTECGEVPIESIVAGDRVWTRKGLRKVKRAWKTGHREPVLLAEFSNGAILRATPDHPIWNSSIGEFLSLDRMGLGDRIEVWMESRYTSTEESTRNTTEDIIDPRPHGFIGIFGQPLTAPYLTNTTFITRTEIHKTIISTIFSACQPGIISGLLTRAKRRLRSIWQRCWMQPRNGGDLSRGENSPECEDSSMLATGSLLNVLDAGWSFLFPRGRLESIGAQLRASISGVASLELTTSSSLAHIAERNSHPINSTKPIPAPGRADNYGVWLKSVTPSENEDVYDIEVEDCHEFYANGILVHNCWMGGDLGFGHSSAIFWACTGKVSPSTAWELLHIDTEWPLDIVIVYRELVPPMRTAEADLGRLIVDATPQEAERHALRKFVMGSDTKTVDRYSVHSRRELIDAITVPMGFPAIRSAQDQPGSRVINARLMYEMLRRTSSMRSENPPRDRPDDKVAPLLLISSECPQLIGAIPLLITDEDKPDDVLKLDTVADDVFDGVKYTLAEYLAVQLIAPREVRKAEYVQRGASLTQQYINALKFDEDDAQNEKRGRKH